MLPRQPSSLGAVVQTMATALEQLQALPPGGAVDVGSREIENTLAVRYDSERFPHQFILLMPWELSYMKQQGIEAGLNYPIDYVIAILLHCPQLPFIQ
jgi:hypothetical protein